ncbi:NAD(P)H-dependent oxidoreductase [Algoriphagus sp.]|uniref:NAD(P)H-dependent oxidoreductase n=1 Tax=Algoriphagus sp. TaxID=1872435 RepID=UPI002616E06C|nr:NAD(P)H-dependent oxidoreductase [Algoriphagus sp.]
MRKILVLFAHPKFEHSDVHSKLLAAIAGLENVLVRDLYELYPDFQVQVQPEQEALFDSDVIIWQHPIYWYSCPPLMKQWIDLVLEYGWAYGKNGTYLKNKYILNAVSSGGSTAVYSSGGRNRFTLDTFLRPFEQTAYLCNMRYLPAFHVGGTHKIDALQLSRKAKEYRDLILTLRDEEITLPFVQKS